MSLQVYFIYVRPKKSKRVGLGVELISLEGAERIDSNHGGVGLPAGGQLNGGGGGGCPQAAEWELPSEAFEQRQEILEGGRTEDQLLVDDAATDQASSVCYSIFLIPSLQTLSLCGMAAFRQE